MTEPTSKAQAVQAAGCALTIGVLILLPLAVLLLFMGPIGWAILAGLVGIIWWAAS